MSSNVKFVRFGDNKVRRTFGGGGAYPRLTNGNGAYAGAPALVQDPAFPMSNVLYAGRSANIYVWPLSAGPNNGSDVLIEFDLGSIQTIMGAVVLGALAANNTLPNVVHVECIPNTNTYSTSGWVSPAGATNISNITSARDQGRIFDAPFAARYWRFRIVSVTISIGFSIASLALFTAITDLGFLYAGADETRILPRTLVESYSRMPTVTMLGPEYRRWELRYENNDAALRAIFDGLYADRDPFIFLTPDGRWQECIWDTEEFTRTHVWAPPDRYAMTVGLRSLP